jgi:hypothetical protein|tara:strand:+ start:389 stop:745 length:357 start_codon:yes stop_codon:yes gene_type:complete
MSWASGYLNGTPFKYENINGVANYNTNNIQFVNNVDGGNLLTIRGASMQGSPQTVYTSVDPSYSITNGDIVYEDAALTSPFDGDDDFYWTDPTCTEFTVAFAYIDDQGELSSRACVST